MKSAPIPDCAPQQCHSWLAPFSFIAVGHTAGAIDARGVRETVARPAGPGKPAIDIHAGENGPGFELLGSDRPAAQATGGATAPRPGRAAEERREKRKENGMNGEVRGRPRQLANVAGRAHARALPRLLALNSDRTGGEIDRDKFLRRVGVFSGPAEDPACVGR